MQSAAQGHQASNGQIGVGEGHGATDGEGRVGGAEEGCRVQRSHHDTTAEPRGKHGTRALGRFFAATLPGGETVWQVLNASLSFAVITALFATISKVVPDVKVAWRDVFGGAALTAALFTAGKLLIGLYLGKSGVASPFGAAGSVVVIVIWVYYSAQILFFGAELTRAYARYRGARVEPTENAEPLTDDAKAQMGIPSDARASEA